MNLTVITDRRGKVIGSARTGKSNDGKIEFGIEALPGQKLHELELTPELSKMKSVDEFHKTLAKLIKTKPKRSR